MITGRITNGKFTPDNNELFKYEFSKREGKQVRIEVKALGPKLRMFRFLYGVVYPAFAEHLGYTCIHDVDRDLKEKFFFEEVENKITGEIKLVPKSKSNASFEELKKYVDDVILFGNTEYGLGIMTGDEFYNQAI